MIFVIILSSTSVNSQIINWDLTDKDTTVIEGAHVDFHGFLEYESTAQYQLVARVENVNIPTGWSFVICNPFSCLNPNNANAPFNFPDMQNFSLFNNGYGAEFVKVAIFTHESTENQIGELDFVLENVTTTERLTQHLIVRTNQTLAVSALTQKAINIYPNPVNSTLYLENIENNVAYNISDFSGRIIAEGKVTNGNIDCSAINKGNYLLIINDKKYQSIHKIMIN